MCLHPFLLPLIPQLFSGSYQDGEAQERAWRCSVFETSGSEEATFPQVVSARMRKEKPWVTFF